MMKNKARNFRKRLNASLNAVQKLVRIDELTPDELQGMIDIYDDYRVDFNYKIGNRFKYEGKVYEVIQAHTSLENWKPDELPALYNEASPANVIPEWVQPTGSQDAYKIGDKVIFQGSVYESLINSNTWSPTAYPAGWKKID